MFDLVVRNGNVVGPERIEPGHLGINDGRIAVIAKPGETIAGRSEIDATGKMVMPGFVDAHAHLREPGLVHKEDFSSGTMAAAAGGVTTIMLMPTDNPWTADAQEFARKRALGEGKAFVDFALQAAVGPRTGDVAELVAAGAVSFELFLTGGHPDFLVENDADFLRLLGVVRDAGGIVGVTAGSPQLVARLTEERKKRGPGTLADFAAVRPPVWETMGVARACVGAAETGARIVLRQLSCGASLDIVDRLADKSRVLVEVTPHNLLLTDEDAERLGPYGAVIPPLRPRAEILALRAALRRGAIDFVATDHAPHLRTEKDRGRDDVWLAASGLPGLQTFCLAMLGLAEEEQLSLVEIAQLCAERPARLFGLHPRKGAIVAGADADLLIIDPHATTEIRDEDQLSKSAATPFAGRRVKGQIDLVMLRGQVIARGGRIEGAPSGRFVRPN